MKMLNLSQEKSAAAFTLIELLIVVAIIAILAAIAVPNLLEAQVRAKVTRAKSDMRTVATALEAYVVDNNSYPPDFTQTQPPFNQAIYAKLLPRLIPLTTPISYVATLPTDGFAPQIANAGTIQSTFYQDSAGNVHNPLVFDYARYDRNHPHDTLTAWSNISLSPESVQWALNSAGPSADNMEFLGNPGLEVYDPTNGTTSQGNVLRTSLGADDRPKI